MRWVEHVACMNVYNVFCQNAECKRVLRGGMLPWTDNIKMVFKEA
jgi:hypothetical protein